MFSSTCNLIGLGSGGRFYWFDYGPVVASSLIPLHELSTEDWLLKFQTKVQICPTFSQLSFIIRGNWVFLECKRSHNYDVTPRDWILPCIPSVQSYPPPVISTQKMEDMTEAPLSWYPITWSWLSYKRCPRVAGWIDISVETAPPALINRCVRRGWLGHRTLWPRY